MNNALRRKIAVLTTLMVFSFSGSTARAESLSTHWQGERRWMGPQWYAGPLQDWSIREDGASVSPRGPRPRFAHVVTHELANPAAGFTIQTSVRIDPDAKQDRQRTAGIVVGVRGEPDQFLHAVVYPERHFLAALTTDGGLSLGEQYQRLDRRASGTVQLELSAVRTADKDVALTLVATDAGGDQLGSLEAQVKADLLKGAIGLQARSGIGRDLSQLEPPEFARFSGFEISGEGFRQHPQHRFGPILWTQYSYSDGLLRIQAQFPPLEADDAQVAEVQFQGANGSWQKAAQAGIEPASSTALFEISDWKPTRDAPYRVAYDYLGSREYWQGTIRREPDAGKRWRAGLFSCDHGDLFPLTKQVAEVVERDPDLLLFAGDQFYEGFGGFGMVREPLQIARLDYLRKWYLFGWTNRKLLRDRPSIIIPDDHDVFQGNLWGQGGRELPGMPHPRPRKLPFAKGGYAMEPDWVHVAQRTQTGHLPPPYDPTPVKQGIAVYYTSFSFGGVSFAVLEDRKFKVGPQSEEAQAGEDRLLGERQLTFVEQWAEDWSGKATIKVVLSQTLFAQGATHIGDQLRRQRETADSNSWPVAGRNRALEAIRKGAAFSLHGDQHLAMLVRHGIEIWDDAGVAFMGPATCTGFARAWWPETKEEAQDAESYTGTGRFRDDYGHPLTVHAVANPLPVGDWNRQDPTELAMAKASGYAMIDFKPGERTMTVNCYPLPYPISEARLDGDQYAGWPQTFSSAANDGRKPIAFLPEQHFDINDPVVGIYDADNDELVYARRIRGQSFTPPVFAAGRYRVRIGEDRPLKPVGVFKIEASEVSN